MSVQAALLLAAMVILYTLQGSLSKVYALHYKGPALAATPVYASVSGAACALATWWNAGFAYAPGPDTLWMGLANGLVLFLYNVAVVNAARTGPYSLQSLMATLGSILLPLVASVVFWQEPLRPMHYAGIAVMLSAAVLFNLNGAHLKGAKPGYRLWITLLLIANGTYGILMSGQQRATAFTQRTEMIITTYATSAAISALFLVMTQRARTPRAFRLGRVSALALLAGSAAVATAVNIMMRALKIIPAPILYTVNNGGVLVFAVLLGSVVWKEKFTRSKAVGLALALTAFVLLGQAG